MNHQWPRPKGEAVVATISLRGGKSRQAQLPSSYLDSRGSISGIDACATTALNFQRLEGVEARHAKWFHLLGGVRSSETDCAGGRQRACWVGHEIAGHRDEATDDLADHPHGGRQRHDQAAQPRAATRLHRTPAVGVWVRVPA